MQRSILCFKALHLFLHQFLISLHLVYADQGLLEAHTILRLKFDLTLHNCSVVELRFWRCVLMEATVLCLVLKCTYLFAVVVCVNFRLPKLLLKPVRHLQRKVVISLPFLSLRQTVNAFMHCFLLLLLWLVIVRVLVFQKCLCLLYLTVSSLIRL